MVHQYSTGQTPDAVLFVPLHTAPEVSGGESVA